MDAGICEDILGVVRWENSAVGGNTKKPRDITYTVFNVLGVTVTGQRRILSEQLNNVTSGISFVLSQALS